LQPATAWISDRNFSRLGDTKFVTTAAETRILPEELEAT
jgi:hypothetical protein